MTASNDLAAGSLFPANHDTIQPPPSKSHLYDENEISHGVNCVSRFLDVLVSRSAAGLTMTVTMTTHLLSDSRHVTCRGTGLLQLSPDLSATSSHPILYLEAYFIATPPEELSKAFRRPSRHQVTAR
ncbi:hypothetical protein J6590_006947 [Homalodisca vitripennis]|nr:hypothetical protein J6590_006947 [Homalodisca vitripennis]